MAAWVSLLTLVVACANGGRHPGAVKTARDVAAEGAPPLSALRAPAFRYRFGIYTSRAPKLDVARELAAAAKAYGFEIVSQQIGPELPPRISTIFLSQPPIEQFAPPTTERLEYMSAGLSNEEKARLTAARAVQVFEVVGPGASAFVDYRKALSLGRDLSQKLGGFLWDEETRVAFSQASFGGHLLSWQGGIPFVNRHITIHVYRDGELFRVVSLGMVKFGLPDISINRVAGTDAERMGVVADLVLQRLLEGATPDARGLMPISFDEVRHVEARQLFDSLALHNAKRRTTLTVVPAEPEEGDADNRLLEITFPATGGVQEQQAHALAELFGDEDTVVYVKNDADLLAASERARKKAFVHGARYADGPPFGEQLSVKAPFKTADGHTEWMWVEVVAWRDGSIDGILMSDAFDIPSLKAGARVEVKAAEIFDYMLIKNDGTHEGNETQPLLDARTRARREKP